MKRKVFSVCTAIELQSSGIQMPFFVLDSYVKLTPPFSHFLIVAPIEPT